MRTIFALILALLTLASACGGEEKEQNEQPQTQGTSAGFTTYAVRSAGVSIAVPESWETATADEIFTDEAIDEIAGDRPEVAEVLHSLGQSNSLMKFFAFDRNASGNYATNASIVVEELPSGLTADRYFEASLTQLKRFVELEGLEQGRVQLPAGEAMHITYTQDILGQAVSTSQYVLFDGDRGYVLTFAALPEHEAEYADTFEQSARSFRPG